VKSLNSFLPSVLIPPDDHLQLFSSDMSFIKSFPDGIKSLEVEKI
jgi:hypothetical protein